MARTLLTKRRLRAIVEALDARLAGEIDIIDEPDSPEIHDYEAARDWAEDELCRRESAQSS
ncbi:hypothetical protein PVT71_14710 [Salipiger sp. H15]|uniref:Uncharacterized protein n=1 Tax=Alloyangia sp. H15 TaxID=3029062 RepID=A0AAU8ANK1_9RHOB